MNTSLTNRRSIRKYTREDVSAELLNSILEAAMQASTTGNMQLYSVVETRSSEMKDKLSPFHFNQPMIKAAPLVLTFCADYSRFKHWCAVSDATPGYDNFLSFITAAMDAIIFAQTVAIAAEDQDLGICYIGTTIYNAKELIDALQLPKGVIPITTLTLGWPDEKPEQTDRLPLNAILHKETYTKFTDREIKDFYASKENLDVNKAYVLENKMKSLAQVFTEVRYKKADNEFFSEKLMEVLKDQGFIF